LKPLSACMFHNQLTRAMLAALAILVSPRIVWIGEIYGAR
jgi:hypothetical protein